MLRPPRHSSSEASAFDSPLVTPPPRASITRRSVLLGLCGTVLISGLTYYNDYALNNTFLIGNNLPLGVVLLLFVMAVFVNGPLSRFAPSHALTTGEISIAFAMTLIACAVPSSGLMRYLPPALVVPAEQAAGRPEFLQLLERLRIPRWVFPTFAGDKPREWILDPIVTGFTNRWQGERTPPYLAWLTPMTAWGVFCAALGGASLCLCALVRRQWFENERLPFPLAEIQLALVEAPAPGRYFNAVLSRRSFWVVFAAVFLLQMWRGMARVWPKYFADIPLMYDLGPMVTERPWTFVDASITKATLFLTVVGVTYFISTPVAVSLFAFHLLMQGARMMRGVYTGDPNLPEVPDQTFGGALAFAGVLLWVGRHHWRLILAQAVRGAREGEPRGRYLPYGTALWLMVGCMVVMVSWLVLAGCTLAGAVALVLLLMTAFLVIARVIAETGLIHGALRISVVRPWQMALGAGFGRPVPLDTFYVGCVVQSTFYDFREVVTVYGTHAMKVADQTNFTGHSLASDTDRDRSTGRRILMLMALSLVVAYIVSFAATLWTEYRYAWTQDASHIMPINLWGAQDNVRSQLVDAVVGYERGLYHAPYGPIRQTLLGATFTAAMAVLRLRYTWWPLHPIGFLILGTYPGNNIWLSVLVGWAIKVLIVRFGGAGFYVACKPIFIGLIVGESIAAGFWLVVGIALSSLGIPYSPINVMPG